MPQNLIEKITQNFAVDLKQGTRVKQGDFLFISPQHILTHDNTGAVIKKFLSMDAEQIHNPRQPMFALDHNVQDEGRSNIQKYADIEAFAHEMGVDFYPAGRGIGHQIMCEEGYAWPGTLAMASDSHANMYGGLGVLGTPVVRTDAAAIWATGKTWWQIPQVARIEFTGSLQPGVTGKDVIITLTGLFKNDEVLNHALEFGGEGVESLHIDDRLTIANMTTEWGALAGVFPIDALTFDWLESRAVELEKRGLSGVPSDTLSVDGDSPRLNIGNISKLKHAAPYADPDAYYTKTISLNLATVEPYIAGPDSVKITSPVKKIEAENLKIHKAYLLSCVNSRVNDLAEAAIIMRGKKVARGVEFYLAAASSEVQVESETRGDWQDLLDAGAIPLPPGCGPCIGLGIGLLGEKEVGISATNRNFKGRMGARSARTFLASPAVVAASAIAGKIVSPFGYSGGRPLGEIGINARPDSQLDDIDIQDGFPNILKGEILFCHQDNLNTDGIFPGKYTYIDSFTPEQQAGVAMENYDPEFRGLVKRGNFLVGGFNFGTGSSREQAATALKYCGLALVIAGSFSATYKRNAINNGFLALEAPDLVKDLLNEYGRERLTVDTDIEATIHFNRSNIDYNGKKYSLSPVGIEAQTLFLSQGLENWVKERLT